MKLVSIKRKSWLWAKTFNHAIKSIFKNIQPWSALYSNLMKSMKPWIFSALTISKSKKVLTKSSRKKRKKEKFMMDDIYFFLLRGTSLKHDDTSRGWTVYLTGSKSHGC